MIVSFVIPTYNASGTIGETLRSIFEPSLPSDWQLDVIVANDGSRDTAKLEDAVAQFEDVTLLSHHPNKGKSAAMNLGISQTRGEIIILLDSDDTLVSHWPQQLETLLTKWPQTSPMCFSACQTQTGETTVADPNYTGPLTFDDILNDRHSGEYLPMFRGDALRRASGYRDPQGKVGCELWTYLTFAKDHDLWISSDVLRTYRVGRNGSISDTIFTPQMANALVDCYDNIFRDFGEDYLKRAPRHLSKRGLRQAVFAIIAERKRYAWELWRHFASWRAPLDTIMAFTMLLFGPNIIAPIVKAAKKFRLLRRYG